MKRRKPIAGLLSACRRKTCGTRARPNSAAGRRGRRRSAYEAPRAAADRGTPLGGGESKRRRRARLCERVRPRLGPPPCRVVRVAGGAPMRMLSERAIFALVCLNLALQVFDGVATYVGVHVGMAEGNPLLAWALAQVGPGFALVLFKLQACACLLLLWHVRRNRLAAPALVFSATVYVVCSLAPWAAALATLHREYWYWMS